MESLDEKLAEATAIIGNNLLRKNKKNLSLIIEKFNLDDKISDALKGLVKDRLHESYEEICQQISKLAEDKEKYWMYLFKFDEMSKKKY